ncbi:MAG TPA: hypothetical protein VJT13_00380 [Xanthobacteraceae bacterium]|nr:hypothetical protein [Xanthobacteraceae bacterium]
MTMAATESNAQIALEGGLRIALLILAPFAILGALAELPTMLLEPDVAFAQLGTAVKMTTSPLIALAALFYTTTRRIRAAIATLAALMLLPFVADLPNYLARGFTLSAALPGLSAPIERVVLALLGVPALALALRGTRLAAATVLLAPAAMFALPKIGMLIQISLFALAVAIVGF